METLPLFALASLVLILTPGPDLIYVMTRGVADGRMAGAVSAIGVTIGLLVHTLAAALGLAVLMKTFPHLFVVVKILGGVYLVYLGYGIVKDKQAFELSQNQTGFDLKKCCLQGIISNVLNPKIALFFVAFLPQFISAESSGQSFQMLGFGLLFALMTLIVLIIIGSLAGGLGSWLHKKDRIAGKIGLASGVTVMLLGVSLIVSA